MSALGRLRAPMAVAVRRLVTPLGPSLLTGFGIALAAAGLAVLFVSRAVVEDRAIADAVAGLSVSERLVSVSWVGTRGVEQAQLDRDARRAFKSLGLGAPETAVSFRPTRFGTEVVRLAAVEDPSALLELRSGRLPRACSQRLCELVAFDAPPNAVSEGFTVVGSATGRAGAILGALVGSPRAGERTLIAGGVDGLTARGEVAGLIRTLTWGVPLDPDRLDSETVASLPGRISEVNTALRNRSASFDLRAPLQELSAAHERAQRVSRHQLLVGGQSAALFFAFILLAASRFQESAARTRFRLRRLGSLRWQGAVEATTHAALVALPAVVLGLATGVGIGALVAAAADRPVADVLGRTAASPSALLLSVLLAVGGVTTIVATVATRTVEIRGKRLSTLDVAAAGILGVVAATFATDQADAAREGPSGVALVLPILIAFAGALVTARLLTAALRLGERVAGSRSPALRLALLSLVRNPAAAVITVVCLAATTGMAVFALSYRTTLKANQRDTAAYAVPLDYRVARDEARVGPLALRTPLARNYDGLDPVGIVRGNGVAPTLNRGERLAVLGIPATALPRLRWREDYAEETKEQLARTISGRSASLEGVAIPAEAAELVLRRSLTGDAIRIAAHLKRRDGGFSAVELGGATGDPVVRARLGAPLRGATLVALTLGFPPAVADTAAHRATGSRPAPDVFLEGTLTLRRLFARTAAGLQPLPIDYRDWVLPDGSAAAGGSRARLRLRYLLTLERDFRIRPRQVTDGQAIPVIASRALAVAAGETEELPVRFGRAEIQVRIAGTAERFPTLAGDFLIVDRDALETAANAASPGSAIADETWLRAPPGREADLARRAPVPVRILSREELQARLRADPVSQATSIALVAGACLAFVLALAGILVAVTTDARDQTGELFDLESLGLPPAGLARHLWLRAVVILAVGLIGGFVTGAATVLVVAEGVSATANATFAEPPVVPTVDWLLLAAGLVGFVTLALASAAVFARTAFRASAPARPEAA